MARAFRSVAVRRVCANPVWTGYTPFNDYPSEDDDDLRRTIVAQLDDLGKAPDTERVRVAPPVRRNPRRRQGLSPRGATAAPGTEPAAGAEGQSAGPACPLPPGGVGA
ncbi:hypothetical protein [Streptomyces sp. IBSBF 2435]|uniref:hypothetical protein n=1 Tax=Streptomyces sp. IBSBF 2435 TaxID=2903531 RepID=UPI002FDBB8FC